MADIDFLASYRLTGFPIPETSAVDQLGQSSFHAAKALLVRRTLAAYRAVTTSRRPARRAGPHPASSATTRIVNTTAIIVVGSVGCTSYSDALSTRVRITEPVTPITAPPTASRPVR